MLIGGELINLIKIFKTKKNNLTEMLRATWDEAKKTCEDLGLKLLSEGIETNEKRRCV